MKTLVSLSSDNTRDYAFILPLTALFWRDVIGFEPLPILVGDWSHPKNQVLMGAFESVNIPVQTIGGADGYYTSTIAQNVREHAAANRNDNESWLMPGDADLWPLKADFYQVHLQHEYKAVSYYANGDLFEGKIQVIRAASRGKDYKTLPTCHVTMKIKTWKELYQYKSTDLLEATVATLNRWLKPKMAGKNPSNASWEAWMSDQRILTEKVCHAQWFPDNAKLINREGHPPHDRLDRGNAGDWVNMNPGRWTDAHLIRCPDENWNQVRPLIAHYLPQHLDWADDYCKRYLAAR